MGYRKSDCQHDCLYDARESAWNAANPDWFGPRTPFSDLDDYTPAPGDPQWDTYAACMDVCNLGHLYDDSAFTTPWPPPDSP
jgi:hypothetical protein